MNDLIRGALSCIFISIPETSFLVLLLIKFCGRKELLDVYRFKENIKWYIILIIPSSILIDILNYGIKVQKRGISVFIFLLFLYILSIFVFKKTSFEEIENLKLKIFLRFIPLYLSLVAIELLTAPVWFHFLHLTYIEIYKNMYLVLLCSLSSRIIEIPIMIFILISKKNKFQINLLDYVYRSNFLKRFSIIGMTFLLFFEIYIIKLVAYNNLLNILNSLTEQIFLVIFFTYLVPSLILTGFYILVNYFIIIIKSGEQNRNI